MDDVRAPLRYLAITGNILFVLWILYNGIDEGFHPAPPSEMFQYLGMMVLLSLNATLLSKGVAARYIAIAGSLVFIVLFAYDFIDRGSQLLPLEFLSHIGIVVLLALNVFLLYRK